MRYEPTDKDLDQIRAGDTDDFKNTLIAFWCTDLDFNHHKLKNEGITFFINLGKALQGTPVTSLGVATIDIGNHLPDFVKALKGTNLNSLSTFTNDYDKNDPHLREALKDANIKSLTLTRSVEKKQNSSSFLVDTIDLQEPNQAPTIQSPVINHIMKTRAWTKIVDFVQRPSENPKTIGMIAGSLLIGTLSLVSTLSALSMVAGGLMLAGAITMGSFIRNYQILKAENNIRTKLSDEKPSVRTSVSEAYRDGCKASNSWTLYFKSCFSKTDWINSSDFGAGMKMNDKKSPGNRIS